MPSFFLYFLLTDWLTATPQFTRVGQSSKKMMQEVREEVSEWVSACVRACPLASRHWWTWHEWGDVRGGGEERRGSRLPRWDRVLQGRVDCMCEWVSDALVCTAMQCVCVLCVCVCVRQWQWHSSGEWLQLARKRSDLPSSWILVDLKLDMQVDVKSEVQ